MILETMFLLMDGVMAGIVAAGIAIFPYLLDGEIQVPLFATGGLLALLLVVGVCVGLLSMVQLLKAVPIAALREE